MTEFKRTSAALKPNILDRSLVKPKTEVHLPAEMNGIYSNIFVCDIGVIECLCSSFSGDCAISAEPNRDCHGPRQKVSVYNWTSYSVG